MDWYIVELFNRPRESAEALAILIELCPPHKDAQVIGTGRGVPPRAQLSLEWHDPSSPCQEGLLVYLRVLRIAEHVRLRPEGDLGTLADLHQLRVRSLVRSLEVGRDMEVGVVETLATVGRADELGQERRVADVSDLRRQVPLVENLGEAVEKTETVEIEMRVLDLDLV